MNGALNDTSDDVNGVDNDAKINETHDGHNDKATTETDNKAASIAEAVKQEASRSPVESVDEPPFSWL